MTIDLLLLGTIGHNSYHGCQKCMIQGVYSRSKSKMCYPRIVVSDRERDAELRTDAHFRNRYQPEHHSEYSALEKLPIDMIRSFPTSDSLHLLDLGIMKRYIAHCDAHNVTHTNFQKNILILSCISLRLLLLWTGDLKSYPRSWSKAQMLEISTLLLKCNETKPSEIHRSVRALKYIKHWKGTEFRTVLLYIGVVLFKDYLSKDEYDLFLNLFCAVTICTTKSYTQYLPVARNLLMDLNEMHINVYGEHSMTNNLHLLSHMIDDVEHLGDLSTISSYPFENALHHIKIRLKQCNRPLQQIARRLHELSVSNMNSPWNLNEKFPKLNHQLLSPDHSDALLFQRIEYKRNVILSSANGNQKDRWFLSNQNYIVQFDHVLTTENGYMIRGSSLKNKEDFFKEPFLSRYINIFISDGEKNDSMLFALNDIKAKLFCVQYKQKFVFIPLLHSL